MTEFGQVDNRTDCRAFGLIDHARAVATNRLVQFFSVAR